MSTSGFHTYTYDHTHACPQHTHTEWARDRETLGSLSLTLGVSSKSSLPEFNTMDGFLKERKYHLPSQVETSEVSNRQDSG